MITVINHHLRQNRKKKPFVSLELQGYVELIQPMQPGKFYDTTRKCPMYSTFDEPTAGTWEQIKGPL